MNMPQRYSSEGEIEPVYAEGPSGLGGRKRTIRDYLYWVLRRLWIVLLAGGAGFGLGFYILKKTPETFESVATIQMVRIEGTEEFDSNGQPLRSSVDTFINTVAQKFYLPKYHRKLAETRPLHTNPNILPKEFSLFPEKDEGEDGPEVTIEYLARIMPLWVEAKPLDGSHLMNIKVTHTDPEICMIIANGLIEAYQTLSAEELKAESTLTVDLLETEMAKLRDEVSKLAARKAGYSECLITKEMIDRADFTIAEWSTRYGHKWPPYRDLKAYREKLYERFLVQLAAVKAADPEEADYWDHPDRREIDPVSGLEPRVTLLQYQLRTAEIDLAQTDHSEKKAKRDKASDGKEFVVERPAPPGMLTGPDPVTLVGKFTLAGTAIGLGIAILLGFVDPTARTIPDLEAMFDLPVLGAIPVDEEQENERHRNHRAVAKIVTDYSPPAEAIRNLRAGLALLGSGGERRSVLLTSSIPGEGKSWVSANLAASFAAQGDNTLLIDLDLRKPTQHKIFSAERAPGVTDLFAADAPLTDAVRQTEHDNLYLLTAGTRSPNPSELLTIKNLRFLMENIPEEIDRIVIDTSPVLAVRDALAPATLADSTVVVFKMAKTPVKALDRLLRIMDENGTFPVGVVANSMPNVRRNGYGYQADYHYGYHTLGGYYGEDPESEDGEAPPKKRLFGRKKSKTKPMPEPKAK